MARNSARAVTVRAGQNNDDKADMADIEAAVGASRSPRDAQQPHWGTRRLALRLRVRDQFESGSPKARDASKTRRRFERHGGRGRRINEALALSPDPTSSGGASLSNPSIDAAQLLIAPASSLSACDSRRHRMRQGDCSNPQTATSRRSPITGNDLPAAPAPISRTPSAIAGRPHFHGEHPRTRVRSDLPSVRARVSSPPATTS